MSDTIDLQSVTDEERRASLIGVASALLVEAQCYGLKIEVEGGRPRLVGRMPQDAIDSEFPRRLKECRREVTIAADTLAMGWRVRWPKERVQRQEALRYAA